jgi:hypothetical protein
MQSSQTNRRDSNLQKSGGGPILPVRTTAFKKKGDSEIKPTPLRTARGSDHEHLPKMSSFDEKKKSMAFPVDSKVVQMTQIADAPEEEKCLQQGSMRSIDIKLKPTNRDDLSRSRSQLGERGHSRADERATAPKSSFYQGSQVTPTALIKPSPFASATSETPESITQTGQSRRVTEINRPMETRRNQDYDHSVVSINSGGMSNANPEAVNRRRFSVVKLINTHSEGDEEFFEGTLIRGRKNGFCRVLYSTSIYKEGFFVNGVLEGEAIIKFPHGITLQGIFKNNFLHSNVLLTVDNTTYPIDYVQGEFHNDKLFSSDKNVLLVTVDSCKDIRDYTGTVRIYFRNGHRLEAVYEKGVVSQTAGAVLFDKFNSPVHGTIKHGINFEENGMAIFTTNDNYEEYMIQFRGEGSVTRKKKRNTLITNLK